MENVHTKGIRRICIWGGPGSGKSTLCAYLFSELKMLNYNVEHVQECIKPFVYDGRKKRAFDDVIFFAKQLHREDILLRNGVEHLVTDSPVLIQTFYSDLVNHCTVPGQIQMAREFEKAHPSINILLDRTGVPFSPIGRYEKSVDDAILLDNKLEQFLDREAVRFVKVPSMERQKLLFTVVTALETQNMLERKAPRNLETKESQ